MVLKEMQNLFYIYTPSFILWNTVRLFPWSLKHNKVETVWHSRGKKILGISKEPPNFDNNMQNVILFVLYIEYIQEIKSSMYDGIPKLA